MEEKQISFKVIKSGTNINDLSKELYSDFLAGVRSDGCDCCASYYENVMFKDVVKWEILEIS